VTDPDAALQELNAILGPVHAVTWNQPLSRLVLWRSRGLARDDAVVLELAPPGELRRVLTRAFGDRGRLRSGQLAHVYGLARRAAGVWDLS
jgi:hypothetical protein